MFSENIQTIKHVSHISSEAIYEQAGKSLISDCETVLSKEYIFSASVGVQDSNGEGKQCGRSNESPEWHHGKRGNA